MTERWNHIRTISRAAITDGVTPGLAVVVGQAGETRFLEAFGQRQVDPTALPASSDTVWDLASLTKPLVTGILAMQAVAAGDLDLDEPLVPPQVGVPTDPAVSVRRALSHSAGFPAHQAFYREALVGGPPSAATRAAVVALARAVPPSYPPGSTSIYSDLGFILLGDLLEQRLGVRLDTAFDRQVTAPLFVAASGRAGLAFRPIDPGAPASSSASYALMRALDGPLAATERCPVRGRVVLGEVHDLNAYAMGGVAGHAGLFGDATGVAMVAHALIAAHRGAPLRAGSTPLVDREVLRLFWSPAGVPGSVWRLGWDGPAPHGSLAGDLIDRKAVGHVAFTGCSLWIDPERETFVSLLANRVHPVVTQDPRFRDLRRAVNDAALSALGYPA